MSSKTRENAITAMFASIMCAVDSEAIIDPTGVATAARNSEKTGFAVKFTAWLNSQGWDTEAMELKQLGYPEFVLRRLTPGIDDMEPFTAATLVSSWHPDDRIGKKPLVRPAGHLIYQLLKSGGFLHSCIGLRTLEWYCANPNNIPSDWYGKTVYAWKSAAQKKIDYVGDVKIVPGMFVGGDLSKLKICWKELGDVWRKDEAVALIHA